ncbi:MAG: hypothetical protein K1X78_15530 [Verrucomicrobiaceae bacterium]|nr:hypothetical protein [Verrucomicrobiaceae bacterium]
MSRDSHQKPEDVFLVAFFDEQERRILELQPTRQSSFIKFGNDRDRFMSSADEIKGINPRMTVVGGKTVVAAP